MENRLKKKTTGEKRSCELWNDECSLDECIPK